MFSSIQILGLGPYYIAVLHDAIFDNRIAKQIDIYRNLPATNTPEYITKPLSVRIHDVNNSGPDQKNPCILGVSGGANKYAVFNYFKENDNISEEHYLTISDKSSAVSSSVEIAYGCFLEQNVSVAAQTKLKFGVSVKRGAAIGHHCVINRFTDINPGAVIAGKVNIG